MTQPTFSCSWRCLTRRRSFVSPTLLPSSLPFLISFVPLLATLLTRFESNDQVIYGKLKRISDFFYSVLCAFVIRDFNMVRILEKSSPFSLCSHLSFHPPNAASREVHEEDKTGLRECWLRNDFCVVSPWNTPRRDHISSIRILGFSQGGEGRLGPVISPVWSGERLVGNLLCCFWREIWSNNTTVLILSKCSLFHEIRPDVTGYLRHGRVTRKKGKPQKFQEKEERTTM